MGKLFLASMLILGFLLIKSDCVAQTSKVVSKEKAEVKYIPVKTKEEIALERNAKKQRNANLEAKKEVEDEKKAKINEEKKTRLTEPAKESKTALQLEKKEDTVTLKESSEKVQPKNQPKDPDKE